MFKTKIAVLLCIFFSINNSGFAQMERQRVTTGGAIEETFWAPTLVGMSTVENIAAKNMNVSIMHSFGIISNRTLKDFFGLDIPPNVRLGVDYGISNNWSIGIGRSTFEKVVDVRTKLALLRQTKSGSIPVSVSFKGDVGLTTVENNRPIGDDLNFLVSVPVARRVNDLISLQVAPLYSHFNTVNELLGRKEDLFALGLGGEFHLSRRYALGAEYYPVISERNDNTKNAFAFSISVETGGHVFQMFFATANWHTEQYIIARNRDNFFEGDFRFGFNVNRLFFLGKNR